MEILVVGAGSLGSLVGGLLARQHDVRLVGRDPHVEAIRAGGLTIEGEIEAHGSPAATTDPTEIGPAAADLALVTVKTYDTESAASTLAECDVDAVCSLQNGLGPETTLADALSVPVLAGTATYGADHAEPGTVTCTGVGEITMGPRPAAPDPEEALSIAEDASEAFAFAGVNAAVDPAMPLRLWEKLAVNAGINPVTALSGVENGALAEGSLADVAREAATETARLASAEGYDLDPDDAAAALDRVVEATADNRSSMRQDVAAGRRTEIDAINGAVLDRAAAHDLDVPVNRRLTALVRGWERGQGLRD